MIRTVVWLVYNVYMYPNITVYLINMYNYVQIWNKNFKYIKLNIKWNYKFYYGICKKKKSMR